MHHTEPPTDKTIREWYMKFQQSGCLCAAKRTGRPGPNAYVVTIYLTTHMKRRLITENQLLSKPVLQ